MIPVIRRILKVFFHKFYLFITLIDESFNQQKMNQEQIRKDWDSRGYSFGVFKDPPGQVWADFVHRTDELVVLAEGEIEIEI